MSDNDREPLTRAQRIHTAIAWVGFILIIPLNAASNSVSDNYWINLAYMIGVLTAVIPAAIFLFILVGRLLQPNLAGAFALAIGSIIPFAFLEVYWLRDIVKAMLAQ